MKARNSVILCCMSTLDNNLNITSLAPREIGQVQMREPPHNLEAEQGLLGAILVNNRAMDRVSDIFYLIISLTLCTGEFSKHVVS